MWLNLFIVFIVFVVSVINSKSQLSFKSRKQRNLNYILIVSVLLVLQSGLRGVKVGSDTLEYLYSFERVSSIDLGFVFRNFKIVYIDGIGKDPGYMLVEKVFSIILGGNYQLYLLSIAILFFSSLAHFLYKNLYTISQIAFAYVLYSTLFYSFFSITGHRQTIATAILLFSVELIKKRRLLLFLIMIIVAATIHKSALIFIPFYYLSQFRSIKASLYIGLFLFPITMGFRSSLANLFKESSGYIDSYAGQYDGAGTFIFTLLMFLVYIFVLMSYNISKKKTIMKPMLINALVFSFLLTPLTWVNPSAMRVVQYFSIFLLLILPLSIDQLYITSKDLRRLVYYSAVMMLIVLIFKSNIGSGYSFFFQDF
ncbi:MAG: EpsG family protein [Tannerellaceae bacterium]